MVSGSSRLEVGNNKRATARGSCFTLLFWWYTCDYVPKGVQEKRTEVLENKVDRLWVSNAFSEWTHVKSSITGLISSSCFALCCLQRWRRRMRHCCASCSIPSWSTPRRTLKCCVKTPTLLCILSSLLRLWTCECVLFSSALCQVFWCSESVNVYSFFCSLSSLLRFWTCECVVFFLFSVKSFEVLNLWVCSVFSVLCQVFWGSELVSV